MRRIYHLFVSVLELALIRLHVLKMTMGEHYVLFRNRNLSDTIKWTKEQNNTFEQYWKLNFGKKISKRGHMYYESINGVFHKNYFPEFLYTTKLEPKLNNYKYAQVFSDKNLFEILFARTNNIKFPETIILNSGGIWYDNERKIIDKEKAKEILESQKEFCIKPSIGGSEGKGVFFYRSENNAKIGNDISTLLNSYSKNFIVQKIVYQDTTYSRLHSSSLNGIRIITYVANNKIHHAPLCLRMGTGKSEVDNLGRGGIIIGVSDDGYLLEYAYKMEGSKEKFDRHPDTGIVFKNYKINGVKEIIETAKKLHTNTPQIGIISWDLCYNNQSEVTLIEANFIGQSLRYPQITHGVPAFGENTELMLNIIKK